MAPALRSISLTRSKAHSLNRRPEPYKSSAINLVIPLLSLTSSHPFMLSRWRKECQEGKIVGKTRAQPGLLNLHTQS